MRCEELRISCAQAFLPARTHLLVILSGAKNAIGITRRSFLHPGRRLKCRSRAATADKPCAACGKPCEDHAAAGAYTRRMTIRCPLPVLPGAPAAGGAAGEPLGAGARPRSWQYACRRRSRGRIVLAGGLSAALHAGLILGLGRNPERVAPARVVEVPSILLTIPQAKELEEPEPAITDEPVSGTDAASLVPMQADLPQIPHPSDFVQQIDFSTLIERPDFSDVKMIGIPETVRRGSTRLAEKIGPIFNPADLDRIPEPLFRPAPAYPTTLKREGVTATVTVEFIVDTEGRAINAVVVHTTYRGFEDAAVTGVEKWKFRAGIRAGRKVNSRMSVPIVFTLAEPSP